MFIGHYGVSFATKKLAPELSLGVTFVAVQALDVVFALDLVGGVEKMRIVPHFTAFNPYDLYWMPWSHSLLAAIAWSIVGAVVWSLIARRSPRRVKESLVVGGAILSHWILDFPMHTPDLQIVPWSAQRVGLGLWNHRGAALIAELVVFLFGVALYVNALPAPTRAGRLRTWAFVGVLVVLLFATPFLPDPPSTIGWAAQALFAYVALAWVATRVDRARLRKSDNVVA